CASPPKWRRAVVPLEAIRGIAGRIPGAGRSPRFSGSNRSGVGSGPSPDCDCSVSEGGPPPLREVIARHGLAARKSLGQNFILDLNLTRRIARAAAPLDRGSVIEIGPGPGSLTRALLAEGARHVIAIERDPRCIAALEEIAAHYPGRLSIVAG